MFRMRTAKGVLDVIKEQDPGTEVTLHYIRGLIANGEVPYTPVGVKKLVDADAVIAYIAAEQKRASHEHDDIPGRIRRVAI